MDISRRKPVQLFVNITPLIDIVFLLLIFFMLTSTFLEHEALTLSIAESTQGTSVDQESIYITVVDKNNFTFEGKTFTEATLKSELQILYSKKTDTPIIIEIASDTPVQLFVNAMDLIKESGFSDISLATKDAAVR